MKHIAFLLLLAVTPPGSLFAQTEMHPVDLNANWAELTSVPRNSHPKDWGANSKFSGGEFRVVAMDDGCALEIQAQDPEGKDLHIFNKEVFVATAPAASVNLRVNVRGTGTFRIFGYLYDAEGGSLGSVEATKVSEAPLNESEFTEFVFQGVVPEGSTKDLSPAKMRIAVAAESGSHLFIKSVTAESSLPQ